MMTAGDELWRTQHGNNNAYNQDNEMSWMDWSLDEVASSLLTYVQRLVAIRAGSPALRQPQFFDGRVTPSGEPDLVWLRPDGAEMAETDWFDDDRRTLGVWIDGANCLSRTKSGELVSDHSWLIVLHAGADPCPFTLPPAEFGPSFEPVLDSGTPDGIPADLTPLASGDEIQLPGRTTLLLRVPRTTK
jgi:glycogen operon protein